MPPSNSTSATAPPWSGHRLPRAGTSHRRFTMRRAGASGGCPPVGSVSGRRLVKDAIQPGGVGLGVLVRARAVGLRVTSPADTGQFHPSRHGPSSLATRRTLSVAVGKAPIDCSARRVHRKSVAVTTPSGCSQGGVLRGVASTLCTVQPARQAPPAPKLCDPPGRNSVKRPTPSEPPMRGGCALRRPHPPALLKLCQNPGGAVATIARPG